MYAPLFHKLIDEGYYLQTEVLIHNFHGQPNEIDIELVKSRYFIDTGEFDTAITILSRLLCEITVERKRYGILLPYIEARARRGQVKLAKSYLEQIENLYGGPYRADQMQRFEFYRLKMYSTIILGEFDTAKQIATDLEDLVVELDNDMIYSKYYMQIARIYDYQGSLLPAIENYKLAMDYAKKGGIILDYLDPLHNISNIYQYQGRYQLAVSGYQQEIEYLENMGFDFYVYLTRNDLGWSYFLQGKDEQSLELLMKAYEFIQDYNASENPVYRAEILTRLIIVASYNKANIDIDQLFARLDEIHNNTDSPRIAIYTKVARGTQLMRSNIFRNITTAMTIFEEITSAENVIDIEFRLYAYLSIVNILFQNYNYANNPLILDEIEDWIHQLYQFAEQQEAPSIKFQADWITAKVKLARGDREAALQLLTFVLKESNRLGFDHIANQVTTELDHIDDDLARSIDQTDFAYFRHDLTRQMLFSGQIQGIENPQLFFIMGNSGMTLYTRHFDTKLGVNENLISSFVNAIQSFGSEAMAHQESLNQIQYQENKILIEQKKYVSIVFVIKGQTYPAQKKLLEFSRILDLPKYRNLFDSDRKHIDENTQRLLDELFDSIFVY